eukprot:gene14665-biopygen11746
MSQPLLNQKQAWPLTPDTFRGSALRRSADAHQNMNGTLSGTLPFRHSDRGSGRRQIWGYAEHECIEGRGRDHPNRRVMGGPCRRLRSGSAGWSRRRVRRVESRETSVDRNCGSIRPPSARLVGEWCSDPNMTRTP